VRLPYVPGSQKLVPLSSASETDDIAEGMPTPSSAMIAEHPSKTIRVDPVHVTVRRSGDEHMLEILRMCQRNPQCAR